MASQGNVLIIDDDDYEPNCEQVKQNKQETTKQITQPADQHREITRPGLLANRPIDVEVSNRYIPAGGVAVFPRMNKASRNVSRVPHSVKPQLVTASRPQLNIANRVQQSGEQLSVSHGAPASYIPDKLEIAAAETPSVEGSSQKLRDNVGAPQRQHWTGRPKSRNRRPSSGNKFVDKNKEQVKANTFSFKAEDQIPAVKVTMLIIKGFGRIHRGSTVKINLDERNERVTIETQSEEELKNIQIRMRECLEQIITKKRDIEKNLAEFLAFDPCRKCLREKLKENKIGAVIDVQTHSNELIGYAFIDENLDKAFKLLDETLITREIQLRPHEGDAVNVSIDKIRSKTTQLTRMFVSFMTVNIFSLVEKEVDEIETKFRNLMKEMKPKEERASVELFNAKARCFIQHVSSELESAIRQRNGQYLRDQSGNDDNIKATITVIGEPGLNDLLDQTVNQIWKERFDFATVSSDTDDKWLLMKGLTGEEGRTYLKQCEVTFNCYIDLINEGTVSPPSGKSRVVVQSTEDSDTSSSSDDDVRSGAEAVVDYDTTPMEMVPTRKIGSNTYIRLQGDVDDQAALALAIQKSMESDRNQPHTQARGLGRLRERSQEFRPSVGYDVDDPGDDLGCGGYSDRQRPLYQKWLDARQLLRERYSRPYVEPDLEPEPDLEDDCSGINTSTYSQKLNGMQIHVVKGDITNQKADALVNIVSSNMDFGETTVSRAFRKAAGQVLEITYDTARHGLNVSRVIVTPGGCGQLKCKVVLHVGLMVGKDNCQACLSNVMSQILQECERNSCQSIALPPLGVGRMYKYSADDCAEQTFLSLNKYRNIGSLQDVNIVVYDDQMLKVFTRALNAAARSRSGMLMKVPPYYQPSAFKAMLSPALSHQSIPLNFAAPALPPQSSLLLPAAPPVPTPRSKNMGFTRPSVQADSHHLNRSVPSKPTPPSLHRRENNSGQRVHTTSSTKSHDDQSGIKRQNSPRVKYQPVTDMKISVFAKDKSTCMNALKEMGKKMKQDLLFEKRFDRVPSLSKETKSEIAKVIDEHNILSITEKEHCLLKGKRDGVLTAHGRILEILLKNPRTINKTRRQANTKRETLEFARFVAQEEPMVPTYWKHYKEDATLANLVLSCKHAIKGKDFEKVEINAASRTYGKIVRMVNETTDASVIGQGKDASGLDAGRYSKLWITKIQRIENLSLFRKYCQKRQSLFEMLVKQGTGAWPKVESLPNSSGPIVSQKHVSRKMASDLHPEINEVLLFHGTKHDTIDTICQGGLDSRLGSGKAMFGPAVYGAEKATKADQYTDDQMSRTYGQGNLKQMFLMRMLLGQCFLCTDQNPTKYKRAPCCTCFSDVCKQHPLRFDSVIGDNKKLFREFVVYDGFQCYPEYLITYERR